MERHTITIKGGKVAVKVEGVKGTACTQATQKIEQALGKVTSTSFTSEYYETVLQTEN